MEGYDAVVVGSGYGGSVAAFRLSMAGFKVCLLEKGRRWEAQDFPRDSWKILSSVRVEKGGVKIGPKDALFQIHQEQDCLAAVACGLGGGSLVNAGVMLPTPASTRRNPKWPKEWETDWEFCQASAAAILRIQTIPAKFQTAKVMDQVLRECLDSSADAPPLKLSVNFDMEDHHLPSKTPRQMGTCLACGNCLAGCPFGAKNSTDKTYLVSAVQAGCTIKTESEVQFIVRNQDDICRQHMTDTTRKRRWLVFLDDYNYITSDFIILSAGVFGTTKILFRSQARGLKFSERLGSGLSCNGNNVAFLAGSSAPLNARGLSSKNFSSVPFKDRPGPSISSSYISSLGFTIQSAVVPSAYPSGLFKGITTYIWPSRDWFLYCIKDKLQRFFRLKEGQEMALNVMGCDESDGEITFKKETESICFRSPRDPLLPRKIEALHKIAKKLGGCLFMSRFRSTSVHLLGGCNAAPDASGGVCNRNGQVFDAKSAKTVHHGLYVCDASLIPCSVGVNPCLTIATIAELVSKDLVRDALGYQSEKEPELSDQFWVTKPDSNYGHSAESETSSVDIKETMTGQIAGMPCSAFLKLRIGCGSYKDCAAGSKHHSFSRGKAGGYLEFRTVEMDRMYVIHGEVDLCGTDPKTPYTQYMHYHLLLGASSGSRYVLEGKKVMNPYMLGLYAWKESTTMHVTFRKISDSASMEENQEMMALKGKLHISFMGFLKAAISVKGNSRLMFLSAFLQSMLRTYILQIPRRNRNILAASELPERQYPTSTLHKIKTEDGFIISCRQWKCCQSEWGLEEGRKLYPVLLINGYSTESFWLPTEPNDLIRTLLQEGHEVWLLQSRVHPLNSSNSFSIEDIGRFDIPSVIDTILEVHGASMKIHVVAHCIGGLAFHIAVMGGHVSAKQIASLSCTNSSMFFKITTSSLVKMWLPLIPISMAILGNNKTLPMFQSSNLNTRQTLLKSLARFLPRYERCTCDECEVFSGIFGNAFWHDNVTQTMHSWLNKVSLPSLPMAAFPHLRKICKSGHIVDAQGNNSYLIHPERMALHTLYISGGRSLLVTPETSFLANKYMKMHRPEFRHGRVVVEGFGHSDLLIGEEADKKVFPHILEHIGLAENGRRFGKGRNDCNNGGLDWGDDPYEDEDDGI
ncbi:uncharacterized protein LOC116006754 [Ipomoea triloba]|uniref:uncharacterized protein LOC116006754 n=1 Tax=Ipomoea triloba TaxID=35885 RepID=UPI00125D54F5|nr:uncharacterized protein LOC116006754 [Ipomoea triloba]